MVNNLCRITLLTTQFFYQDFYFSQYTEFIVILPKLDNTMGVSKWPRTNFGILSLSVTHIVIRLTTAKSRTAVKRASFGSTASEMSQLFQQRNIQKFEQDCNDRILSYRVFMLALKIYIQNSTQKLRDFGKLCKA